MASSTLPSGAKIPHNGLGTWKGEANEVTAAVITALETGYRHIDCAAVYLNEPAVGNAISSYLAKPKTSRSDIFITSKAWNTCHAREDVVKACRQSLKDLQVDYLDLFLVHHPFAWPFTGLPITEENWVKRDAAGAICPANGVTLQNTWEGMEDCVRLGLVRDIGVSNYSVLAIMDLLQYATIKPAVNQCEAHVYNTRSQLRSVCESVGIHFTMYSILGSGKEGPLGDPVVARIAKEKGATSAQVLVAWGLAKGCSVLAKSSKPKRVEQNFESQNIVLEEKDMADLDALDREMRVCDMTEYWGFPSHA